MPLESRIIASQLDKSGIEELQLKNFVALAQVTKATGPITSCERVVKDPPDFLVSVDGAEPLAVELTTLSTTDVSRQRTDEIRNIGRALEKRIRDNPADFPHLQGRVVGLLEMSADHARPKKRRGPEFDKLIDTLADGT